MTVDLIIPSEQPIIIGVFTGGPDFLRARLNFWTSLSILFRVRECPHFLELMQLISVPGLIMCCSPINIDPLVGADFVMPGGTLTHNRWGLRVIQGENRFLCPQPRVYSYH